MPKGKKARYRMNRAVGVMNKGDEFTAESDHPMVTSLVGAGYADVVSENEPEPESQKEEFKFGFDRQVTESASKFDEAVTESLQGSIRESSKLAESGEDDGTEVRPEPGHDPDRTTASGD